MAGEIICWGHDEYGLENVPPGLFVDLTLGSKHSCALTEEGSVACWGGNDEEYYEEPPPLGPQTSIDAGDLYTCGVGTDHIVRCGGSPESEESLIPVSTYLAVDAGLYHTCGLTTEARIRCWNCIAWDWDLELENYSDACEVPDEEFASVSIGFRHSCGMTVAGSLKCWGENDDGQACDSPSCMIW